MVKCKFFITRNDNTHNMKIYKNLFRGLKNAEDNYISMTLKPNSMILAFELCCKSFDFYLDIFKRMLYGANSPEVWAVVNTLFLLIDNKSFNESLKVADKKKIHFDGGTITIILEEANKDDKWIFYSVDIESYELSSHFKTTYLGYNRSLKIGKYIHGEHKTQYISYDYSKNEFTINGSGVLLNAKELIYLALLFNSGHISHGQEVIIEDEDNNKTVGAVVSCHRPNF